MFGFNSKSNSESSTGCTYVLGLGLLIISLLLFNAWIVEVFLEANGSFNLDLRITQAAQFVLPVLLIFVQFWMFDVVVDYLSKRS